MTKRRPTPARRYLVLTGNDAAMDEVGDLTAPQIEWYARRHGYDFERVRHYDPGSHPSWQKMRLILERIDRYDAILWIDADVVVTNPTRRIQSLIHSAPHQADQAGLLVSTDWTYPAPEDAIKHFSLGNFIAKNNPALREIFHLALQRTEWANTPLWEQQAIQEEYRANEAIRSAVHVFPRRWLNAVYPTEHTTGPEPWRPGDFLCHFTYLPNAERARLIPEAIVAGFRRSIPWMPADHAPGMSMDARHVAILHEIARRFEWESVLEIGVWEGGSTAAFVEPIRRGEIRAFTACDVQFLDRFHQVIAPVADRVRLVQMSGVDALRERVGYDLILVDGDHSLETGIAETAELLRRANLGPAPKLILAHDVDGGAGGGPAHLMQSLREAGYCVLVDDKHRPGELTHRGLMAATKDPALAGEVSRIFAGYAW